MPLALYAIVPLLFCQGASESISNDDDTIAVVQQQVKHHHAGAESKKACAPDGADPYNGYDGNCCYPLAKVKNKWYSNTCSFKCMTCSHEGEDPYRYCGSG